MKRRMTEKRFSAAFLRFIQQQISPSLPRLTQIVAELDAHQGRPDFVASPNVAAIPKARRAMLADALVSPSNARLLALLKKSSPRTEAYLRRATGLSPSIIQRSLQALTLAKLIEQSGDSSYLLSKRAPTDEIELWAFELKIDHWQRALFQALQYRAFAHRTVIVLPESSAHLVEHYKKHFRSLSVGVMAFDPLERELRVIVSPKRRSPTSRFHYLYALGRFLP